MNFSGIFNGHERKRRETESRQHDCAHRTADLSRNRRNKAPLLLCFGCDFGWRICVAVEHAAAVCSWIVRHCWRSGKKRCAFRTTILWLDTWKQLLTRFVSIRVDNSTCLPHVQLDDFRRAKNSLSAAVAAPAQHIAASTAAAKPLHVDPATDENSTAANDDGTAAVTPIAGIVAPASTSLLAPVKPDLAETDLFSDLEFGSYDDEYETGGGAISNLLTSLSSTWNTRSANAAPIAAPSFSASFAASFAAPVPAPAPVPFELPHASDASDSRANEPPARVTRTHAHTFSAETLAAMERFLPSSQESLLPAPVDLVPVEAVHAESDSSAAAVTPSSHRQPPSPEPSLVQPSAASSVAISHALLDFVEVVKPAAVAAAVPIVIAEANALAQPPTTESALAPPHVPLESVPVEAPQPMLACANPAPSSLASLSVPFPLPPPLPLSLPLPLAASSLPSHLVGGSRRLSSLLTDSSRLTQRISAHTSDIDALLAVGDRMLATLAPSLGLSTHALGDHVHRAASTSSAASANPMSSLARGGEYAGDFRAFSSLVAPGQPATSTPLTSPLRWGRPAHAASGTEPSTPAPGSVALAHGNALPVFFGGSSNGSRIPSECPNGGHAQNVANAADLHRALEREQQLPTTTPGRHVWPAAGGYQLGASMASAAPNARPPESHPTPAARLRADAANGDVATHDETTPGCDRVDESEPSLPASSTSIINHHGSDHSTAGDVSVSSRATPSGDVEHQTPNAAPTDDAPSAGTGTATGDSGTATGDSGTGTATGNSASATAAGVQELFSALQHDSERQRETVQAAAVSWAGVLSQLHAQTGAVQELMRRKADVEAQVQMQVGPV